MEEIAKQITINVSHAVEILAAVIIGITFGALSLSANNKVLICHVTGNGSAHVIDIDEHAMPAHLAHGDSLEAAATWLGAGTEAPA